MALNNLRVIYNNLVDLSATTVTASSSQSANTGVANLKSDIKSKVWRSSPNATSSTTAKAILMVDFGSNKPIGGVVLAFTNLVSNAAIKVVAYSVMPTLSGTVAAPTITGGTAAYTINSGNTANGCPWNTLNLPNWGIPQGANTYAYGGGTYARVWMPANTATAVRGITIEITDTYSTSATNRFIEVSKLIVGPYWSPKYNTGYGMTSEVKDSSKHERTQAGDLITIAGPRYNTLKFDMKWLDPSDRIELTKMLLGNGMPKPLLVSLFPDNSGTAAEFEQERAHMIYGKLVSLPGVSYATLQIYSTSLELEEI